MAEHPIIMSEDSVRAILRGLKTATRRVLKPQPHAEIRTSPFVPSGLEDGHGRELHCPYGVPGDRLWVRESWRPASSVENFETKLLRASDVYYRADDVFTPGVRWRSALFMPWHLSRIRLKVTGVRVQRLQSVTDDDLVAEGSPVYGTGAWEWFIPLWDALNKRRGYGWDTDPWVWVVEFEMVKKTARELFGVAKGA